MLGEIDVKRITVDQMLSLPWSYDYEDEDIRGLFSGKESLSALDLLQDGNLPPEDKLQLVLREELLDDPILHDFACRCAEDALKLLDNPDPRCVAAVAAKRTWLRGEMSDEELEKARDDAETAARSASRVDVSVAYCAAYRAADDDAYAANHVSHTAAYAATLVAWNAAYDATYDSQWDAGEDSNSAARDDAHRYAVSTARKAYDTTWRTAYTAQANMLIGMLRESGQSTTQDEY